MKTTITIPLLVFCLITTNESNLRANDTKVEKDKSLSISLNGNGATVFSSGVSSDWSFNPNAEVEFGWGNFGLGINVGSFSTKSNFDFESYANSLKSLDFLTITGVDTHWRSTTLTIGPSYSILLRSVKPISGVGIVVKHNYPKASLKIGMQAGITFNQSPSFLVMNNFTRNDIASYIAPTNFEKNALTFIPSVRFNYWFSQNIAIGAHVQYAVQTGQTAFTTGYKDLSKVDITSGISPDQFSKNVSTAPEIIELTVGPHKYLSVGAGLIIRFLKQSNQEKELGNFASQPKGINQSGLKRNVNKPTVDTEDVVEVPVSLSKGWDGSVKGSRKAITQSGIKRSEAIRKGWDGTVKGSHVSIPIGRDVVHIQTIPTGCIVLFSDGGFVVNSKERTMSVLSKSDHEKSIEKIQAGLQSAGGALAQGASLLGGALPGGAVVSAVVSLVSDSTLRNGYVSNQIATDKKKKRVWDSRRDDDCDGMINMPDGEYELEVVFEDVSKLGTTNANQTVATIEFSSVSNVLKTKHDTVKNSINNVR